jgi:Ca2+/H+ antiporter, TMEM165/GDT1 family
VEALLVSTGIVALAEIGDKTQLLAFVLAIRFRKPLAISLGITVATLANHALAGLLGAWIASLTSADTMRWILGVSFIAMAVWVLIPDKLDPIESRSPRLGVFCTTLLCFFLVEIGDKTQVATVALAIQYQSLGWVVLGTTLGMLVANVPAVVLGERIAKKIPVRMMHAIAALLFAALGIAAFAGVGSGVIS